ncbi:hypothetical protein MYSTI_01160 [Myxococcus stipitatus DSM 14675]|uniref:Uncharacterized protein n=1 Tax=Myxococcus stipitatus (strain DSM 14675 / JCM 12634 / Mx s8) TaxID=1278073 RepID=L7U2U7_MYXSD|nr:hypothetical protein [Myxococcus stipitatus]AGC42508.1 hypothetical protein MYSTI_01160 [Myxococcus stipitatus DSM 14675]
MPHRRLLLFIADVEGNLTAVRQTLQRVCESAALPTPEVKWVESPPEGLSDGGWHAAELALPPAPGRKSRKSQQPFLEEQLDAMTQALAQDFQERALGVFVDREHSYARTCTSGPGKPAKAVEGEVLDVVRQAARWLDVETGLLARMLGGGDTARNLLAAAVDFGGEAAAPARPPEPDEDDRFVEAKLAQARVYMQQYLSARK